MIVTPSFKYLFIDPPIHLQDLTVHGYALHEAMPVGFVHRDAGTAYYLFQAFAQETIVVRHGVRQPVPVNSLIIWEPGVSQCYGCGEQAWRHSWFGADGLLLQELLDEFQLPCNQALPLHTAALLERFLIDLQQELTEHYTPRSRIVQDFLYRFLSDIHALNAPESDGARVPRKLLEAKRYMDTHFAEHITLEQLAEHTNLSVHYFVRLFKKQFEFPPIEYLLRLRMHHALDMLNDMSQRITDIAERVGISDIHYFSSYFHRYYGVSPREMRKSMSSEAVLAQCADERKSREVERLLREGWMPVIECDFAHDSSLDPRWRCYRYRNDRRGDAQLLPSPELVTLTPPTLSLLPAPQLVSLIPSSLRLLPTPEWTQLRWEEALGEEVKIELTLANTSPQGLNCAIALSGDSQHGYRLRLLGYSLIEFETVCRGYWQLLYQCPITLNPTADAYRVSLWRSGNDFYAEIDGQRIMDYHDPMPPQGAPHRHFALCRFLQQGSLDIRRLRVLVRQYPRYVDGLEPGRVLLRHGHRQEAADWFAQFLQIPSSPAVQHEVQYLLALSLPEDAVEERETHLLRICAESASPFRRRAMRELAYSLLQRQDYPGAVDAALELQQTYPDESLLHPIAKDMCNGLYRLSQAEREAMLQQILRLPITHLDIPDLALPSLAALHGMALQYLLCDRNRIEDLSPLRGMPLSTLHCKGNAIASLAPLGYQLPTSDTSETHKDKAPIQQQRMPLHWLECCDNAITDLSPLAGLPLVILHCNNNRIASLAPLQDMPLKILCCSDNLVTDLTPLRGAGLQLLYCPNNRIGDLSPLSALPLQSLVCNQNVITDLSPLATLPLTNLGCGDNPISDLSPLRGLPITSLSLYGIPVTDAMLPILAALPLRQLSCDLTGPCSLDLLNLPTLQGFNSHSIDYMRRMAHALSTTLREWHAVYCPASGQVRAPLSHEASLRPWATSLAQCAVLAVPALMPRAEALAFAQWQGGTLCCPSTADGYQQLVQYLCARIHPGGAYAYHIGLSRSLEDQTLVWQSGTPYLWRLWTNAAAEARLTATECACLASETVSMEDAHWVAYSARSKHFVLIEWAI